MSRAGLTQREGGPKMTPRETQGCHYRREKKSYSIILIERRVGAATDRGVCRRSLLAPSGTHGYGHGHSGCGLGWTHHFGSWGRGHGLSRHGHRAPPAGGGDQGGHPGNPRPVGRGDGRFPGAGGPVPWGAAHGGADPCSTIVGEGTAHDRQRRSPYLYGRDDVPGAVCHAGRPGPHRPARRPGRHGAVAWKRKVSRRSNTCSRTASHPGTGSTFPSTMSKCTPSPCSHLCRSMWGTTTRTPTAGRCRHLRRM